MEIPFPKGSGSYWFNLSSDPEGRDAFRSTRWSVHRRSGH